MYCVLYGAVVIAISGDYVVLAYQVHENRECSFLLLGLLSYLLSLERRRGLVPLLELFGLWVVLLLPLWGVGSTSLLILILLYLSLILMLGVLSSTRSFVCICLKVVYFIWF